MQCELCGVGILATVLVEDILLYSHTFLKKGRDGAGLTIETCVNVVPNLYRNSMLLILKT